MTGGVGVTPATPQRGAGTPFRVGILAAAALLLVGVALVAGGLGPWTARDISTSPADPQTGPPPTRTLPSVSTARPVRRVDPPEALGWGVRLFVIAIIAIVVLLVARWLFRKFQQLAAARDESTIGGPPPVSLASQSPPPVREGESGRDFDPRAAADAIISCWLWVESASTASGFPRRKQDTPTEFLAGFVTRQSDSRAQQGNGPVTAVGPVQQAADELLPLYQRARFDQEALDSGAAVRARTAAETLCATVRRAAKEPTMDDASGQR